MKSYDTEYGTLKVGKKSELFQEALDQALRQFGQSEEERYSWALTGGSTPKDFYKWLVKNEKLPVKTVKRIVWTTSDERMAPLESEENNFGNADRFLLSPLGVPNENKVAWPTALDPHAAAAAHQERWKAVRPSALVYDVCFVGMGDDCHTLSLFPGSPLIQVPAQSNFAAVEVPGKGWRLTLTPIGLGKCGKVVLMTMGKGKAEALKAVLQGDYDPLKKPSQNLKAVADRAVWLVDDAAASQLEL